MTPTVGRPDPETDALIDRIGQRAGYLFKYRRMRCAEAVVVALNQEFNGGLTDTQAAAVAAPFSEALGGSGCLCGALSGAVLAAGLLLGQVRPDGPRKHIRAFSRRLHDGFRTANGGTCCRVLSKPVLHDRNAHFRQCTQLTANTAVMAARMLLQAHPLLAARARHRWLDQRPPSLRGVWGRMTHYFLGLVNKVTP